MTQNLTIDNIDVKVEAQKPMSEVEIREYIKDIRKHLNRGDTIEWLIIGIDPTDPENAILDYNIKPLPFSRIRRITGKPKCKPVNAVNYKRKNLYLCKLYG